MVAVSGHVCIWCSRGWEKKDMLELKVAVTELKCESKQANPGVSLQSWNIDYLALRKDAVPYLNAVVV